MYPPNDPAASIWPPPAAAPQPETPAAAPGAAAVPLPAPGSLARYTVHDVSGDPDRDRDQLILVTGYHDAGEGRVYVRGLVLGYADQAASFVPEDLRQA